MYSKGSQKQCGPGTTDRPIIPVKLASGTTFCLRMPRYLKNPRTDYSGGTTFPRTYNDTCGLYGITFHPHVPEGGGPDPHLHLSDEEYFMPVTPGDVLRVFTQAGPKHPRKYQPGEVPGYNLPPVSPMGHVDVPAGTIAFSPPNTPHTWKAATSLTNYVIFWLNGFVMEPSINIPQMSKNATQVLWESALWSSPTDITSVMFGGPDYLTRALERDSNLPSVTLGQMRRLQDRFDRGEDCFPKDGLQGGN